VRGETCKEFACIVIIGTKMKIFKIHSSGSLDIPRVSQSNVSPEDLRQHHASMRKAQGLDLWFRIGLDVQGFKDKIEWKTLEYFKDGEALDVFNVEQRSDIDKAVQWVADMADRKGLEDRNWTPSESGFLYRISMERELAKMGLWR
jgi:hypothetical protein